MGKGNTCDEIMDYFDLDTTLIPTQSAFNQRRSQISLSAFEYLFSEFSSAFPVTTNKFKEHCILACDGCHVVYTTNSEIIEDYNKPRLMDYKGYNHMHLNGFVDVVIQPGQDPDEREALHTMLDHFHPDDREEFDVIVIRFFTNKYTNIMKEQSHVYHYMNPYKNIPHFPMLLNGKHLYFMQFRVLKIKTTENTYEYIITNLPYSFDLEDIKDCYHMRWGCEISFRYLKHANGLLYFHSKKPEKEARY